MLTVRQDMNEDSVSSFSILWPFYLSCQLAGLRLKASSIILRTFSRAQRRGTVPCCGDCGYAIISFLVIWDEHVSACHMMRLDSFVSAFCLCCSKKST